MAANPAKPSGNPQLHSARTNKPRRSSRVYQDAFVYAWGCFLILLGLGTILFSVIFEEHHVTVTPEGTINTLSSGWMVALKILDHIGVAFISIGFIGIILESRDWRRYFQERLGEIVTERAYLSTLKDAELLSLQTETLKAYFKDDQLDRADSFLEFYQRRIHNFISSPYREGVHANIFVDYMEEDEKIFQIKEAISYKCRKVRGLIQDDVKWITYRDSKVIDIQKLQVTVHIPPDFFQAFDFKAKYPDITENKLEYLAENTHGGWEVKCDVDKLKERFSLIDESGDRGFSLSLSPFKEIDDILIEVEVDYTMFAGWPLSWMMTHPSKDLDVVVTYPSKLTAEVNLYGLDFDECVIKENPGSYTLKYYSWLLPNVGMDILLGKLEKRNQTRPTPLQGNDNSSPPVQEIGPDQMNTLTDKITPAVENDNK